MKQQQLYNSAPAAPWIHCQSRATHNVLISSTPPSFLLCDAMRWESRCGSITLPVAVLSRILRRSFFYKAKDSVAAYRRVVVWANRSKKKCFHTSWAGEKNETLRMQHIALNDVHTCCPVVDPFVLCLFFCYFKSEKDTRTHPFLHSKTIELLYAVVYTAIVGISVPIA